MTDTFRALCAELLRGLDENRHPEVRYPGHLRQIMASARAALADEPAVPEGREPASVVAKPSDEELDLLVIAIQALTPHQPDATTHNLAAVNRGRELLRDALTRWSRPAPAPQVEGEVAELVRDLNREVEAFVAGESSLRWLRGSDLVRIAKLLQSLASPAALVIPSSPELLEQLKSLPPGRVELHAEAADVAQALEPVPVSERLPGPGDCDAEGRCWLLTVEDEYPQWRLHSIEGARPGGAMIWVPVDSDTGIMCDCFYTSHWLPAHALPLPSGEVEK